MSDNTEEKSVNTTDNVVSLNEKKALKEGNASLWTPLDAAKAFIRDCESGEIEPTSVAIVYWNNKDNCEQYAYYVASPNTADTLYLLSVAQQDLLLRGRR